jgi:hypothetical protein|tara:strand:+ start:3534 stop:4154 length:621 start_codon:yes stop_codon:yes gene_type:complete
MKQSSKNKAGDSVLLGSVCVDSGQLLIVDPAYLKDWRDDLQYLDIRRYTDEVGRVYQYRSKPIHGFDPKVPKKFTKGVDEFFGHYNETLSTGKTPNQHLKDGDWKKVAVATGYENSFSYAGACHATLEGDNEAGMLGDKVIDPPKSGFGLALATRTMWGDGVYDVLGIKNDDGVIEAIVIPLDIYDFDDLVPPGHDTNAVIKEVTA